MRSMTNERRDPRPKASQRQGRDIIDDVLGLLDTIVEEIKLGPVAPQADLHKLNGWLAGLSLEAPDDALEVIRKILEHVRDGTVHATHPRYFGLFVPAPLLWGEIADVISARLNPQLATWSHAPAAVEIEQRVLSFVADRLGLTSAAAFFTSGGEEANRCGVQVGLVRAFPDYAEQGIHALGAQPVLYVSEQSHLAWIKIASSLGLGRSAVRLIPVESDLKMHVPALVEAIARDRTQGLLPFFLGATAGTTSAGVIDPLEELAEVAASNRLHYHVDAAWAGAVALSDRWRPLLAGIERADSVTIDGHKWLSQPLGTGMFLCRDLSALENAFTVSAPYMPPIVEGAVDYYRTTPTWSRRWIGLRLFLSLAIAGRRAFEQQIDRDIHLGDDLRKLLVADGWSVINDTPLPVICFTDSEEDRDGPWHDQVAAHVVASGRAWISTVRLGSRPGLRACITNWQSSHQDLLALIEALSIARSSVGSR